MPSNTSLLASPLELIRSQLRGIRQARAEHESLRRDLSAYTSDSDLNDLDAILDRYDDSDTGTIREILATQRSM